MTVQESGETVKETVICLQAIRGCAVSGLQHLLAVGHDGRMVHLLSGVSTNKTQTDSFRGGSIFYPGRFGASIKRVWWSEENSEGELSDQYGDSSRLSLESGSAKAQISGHDGVYQNFRACQQKILFDSIDERHTKSNELAADNDVLILAFSDKQCENVSLVGGKGASLSKLTHNGLNVPSGFCLTTNMFQKAISQDPQVQQALNALQEYTSQNNLAELCRRAEDAIRTSSMAEDFLKDIEAFGNNLMESAWECRWAVQWY